MLFFRIAEARSRRRAFVVRDCFGVAVVIVLALLSSARVTAQDPGSNDSQTEVVRGTVINSVTQAPIPRALVFSPDNRYALLTDGDGHFEFTVPKQQTADFSVGAMYAGPAPRVWSFGRNQAALALSARKPGFLDVPFQIPMAVESSDGKITIPLLPEGIINGRVTAGGEPAAGVTVQLYSRQVQDGLSRWVTGASASTNSAGEFRFAELLPGSYKVESHEWMDNDPAASIPGSQLNGYPPVYYPGVPDFGAAGTIELAAGQTAPADLAIVRQPYFQVQIPIAGTEFGNGFAISVEGQHGVRYELGYNPEEQRIEGMLPSGSYVVQASTYGPNSVSGSVSIRVADGPVQGPSLTVTPNTSIPVNVKIEFAHSSALVSVGAGGRKNVLGPRSLLQLNVESVDDFERRGGSIRPPTSPDDQSLALESLPPGRYWLRLSTAHGYVSSASMGSTDLLREPLVIGAGASTPIEVTLRDDGAEIDGTVNSVAEQGDSSGSVPVSARVYCVPLPESTGQFQEIGVSQDGKFTAQMMAPGDYRILAFSKPQPGLPYRDIEAMKAYDPGGQVVHLSAGQKMTIQVQSASTE
jgi:hypothetical protein